MDLPADTHVHSEWSWDTGGPDSAAAGTMARTCARAQRIGLPALAFTEHLDLETDWRVEPSDLVEHQRVLIHDGRMRLPRLDAAGYLECVERCRAAKPGVHVLTGLEFGQPHRYWDEASQLYDLSAFDRINGSVHTLPVDGGHSEPMTLFHEMPADDVLDAYLTELIVLAGSPHPFTVVTHVDYALRSWPTEREGPFDPRRFEDGFRAALRAIAASERALELNTRRLWPWLLQWWVQEGGRAVCFGSDAHVPSALAEHFGEATLMAESAGFRPGRRPEDFWTLG